MFSIHSQGEKIDVLGNFYWCEFHLFSPKLREVRFLTLKIGGRLIHKVDLYTSKYGIDEWKSAWAYKALFSCFAGNSSGVCILFNINFKFDILKTFSDASGRYIVCDIRADKKFFTLANIYAPNEDYPTFFKQGFDHLHDFVCEEIILGGDFNLVLDFKEDKKGGLPRTYQNALKIIQQNCKELILIYGER